ncbi:putative ribonuclease H-like domain-containing protein, partial [Tanacetum coccineum]
FGSIKKSWCDEFEALMKSRFQMSSMGELTFFLGLQVKQKPDGIFISQDKYVAEILKKFDFANVKTASTPIETQKPLVKDEEASDVDVHLYRSMIGSLMYLTASRRDIMFTVCACSRFQVTPKSSHLSAVKRIFRYLKGKPKLGLWYPRVSSFDLESYSDSDYAGANLDRKSTTGGCQFLGRRLISWQCKKQTIVATSTTEAEYVAAASCCGKFVDSKSNNPVYHSKTKHIAIRHHFIRDAYEKKLIQVLKIHTDDNVADLLTKAFDVSRGLIGFRESLRRVIDGTEALLLPTLFILWLDTDSTDSAKLVPLGKVCTAIETLKKNTAKALISLLTTITLSTTMAVLDSCPKHNMVAYLEKTEGNAEFHEIIDFLTRSSIHHALTAHYCQSSGKPMSILKHSIQKYDILFDDANGIRSHCPIRLNLSIQGSHPFICFFVGNTKLRMRVAPSERSSEAIKPTPSLAHIVKYLFVATDRSFLLTLVTDNEGEMTPLQSVYDLCLSYVHSLDQAKNLTLEAQIQKLKKQAKPGKMFANGEPSVLMRSLFDEIPEGTLESLKLRMSRLWGGQEIKCTDKEKVSTDRPIVSTDGSKVSTDRQKDSTAEQIEGTDEQRKGKKKIEEEVENKSEYDGIPEAERRLNSLQVMKKCLIRNFDDIKARIEADRLLAEKASRIRRGIYNRRKSKILHDTIHVGNFKHSELKTKKFEEIQALYEKIKRSDEDFFSFLVALDEEKEVDYEILDRKYPIKNVKTECLGTKPQLESEEDSTMALELIRFIKKQIAELEPEDSDGDKKDI